MVILDSFHSCFNWLAYHPAFYFNGPAAQKCRQENPDCPDSTVGFKEALNIDVVMVNPYTKCIEDDPTANTEMRVWLECGPWASQEELPDVDFGDFQEWTGYPTHDTRLDIGAPTFEEAICQLATSVLKIYGDYTPVTLDD